MSVVSVNVIRLINDVVSTEMRTTSKRSRFAEVTLPNQSDFILALYLSEILDAFCFYGSISSNAVSQYAGLIRRRRPNEYLESKKIPAAISIDRPELEHSSNSYPKTQEAWEDEVSPVGSLEFSGIRNRVYGYLDVPEDGHGSSIYSAAVFNRQINYRQSTFTKRTFYMDFMQRPHLTTTSQKPNDFNHVRKVLAWGKIPNYQKAIRTRKCIEQEHSKCRAYSFKLKLITPLISRSWPTGQMFKPLSGESWCSCKPDGSRSANKHLQTFRVPSAGPDNNKYQNTDNFCQLFKYRSLQEKITITTIHVCTVTAIWVELQASFDWKYEQAYTSRFAGAFVEVLGEYVGENLLLIMMLMPMLKMSHVNQQNKIMFERRILAKEMLRIADTTKMAQLSTWTKYGFAESSIEDLSYCFVTVLGNVLRQLVLPMIFPHGHFSADWNRCNFYVATVARERASTIIQHKEDENKEDHCEPDRFRVISVLLANSLCVVRAYITYRCGSVQNQKCNASAKMLWAINCDKLFNKCQPATPILMPATYTGKTLHFRSDRGGSGKIYASGSPIVKNLPLLKPIYKYRHCSKRTPPMPKIPLLLLCFIALDSVDDAIHACCSYCCQLGNNVSTDLALDDETGVQVTKDCMVFVHIEKPPIPDRTRTPKMQCIGQLC
ncbi:hypothetical protein CLF_103901 [Clonorchis sinensis]|uniref:Uncharacterized protein n=1 Tax=Clonorchis sinensis TaxID=79923 RepID=G7YAL0_CLOSI|nr:hypothetical protein CLF_103901 [Clonorchis sinensis]